jgi:hypothetical protein
MIACGSASFVELGLMGVAPVARRGLGLPHVVYFCSKIDTQSRQDSPARRQCETLFLANRDSVKALMDSLGEQPSPADQQAQTDLESSEPPIP